MRLMMGLALLLVGIVPAAAENLLPNSYVMPDGSFSRIIPPPDKYIDPTFASLVHIDVQFAPQPHVTLICSEAAGKFEDLACTWPDPSNCRILIADNLSAELSEAVLIHERAHCFGWPGDHPSY